MTLTCEYFDAGTCRSCSELRTPYDVQVSHKMERVNAVLGQYVPAAAWLPPVGSPEQGFRNKAKLAVGGTAARPTLGITDRNGRGIDLRECKIQAPQIWDIIPDLAGFITYADLQPYDVAHRRGELKFIHVTVNTDGELMLRFVLRTERALAALREALPALQTRLPQIRVISANFLPEHKAVTEGEREIALSDEDALPMRLGGVTLYLRHKSFFQTNTVVAEALYTQAQTWANDVDAHSVLDLYCGVGGFALHLDREDRTITGLEIEKDAVRSGQRSARERGISHRVHFAVRDMTDGEFPDLSADLVVVNPPRRGIGELAQALEHRLRALSFIRAATRRAWRKI